MVSEILGKDHDDEDEADECGKLAHEAYQAHKEMGEKHEAAMEKAGDAVKLARHMASKQAEAEAEANESEAEGEDNPPPKKKPVAKKPAPKADDDKSDDDGGDDDEDADEAEAEAESESESENKESKKVKALRKKLLEAEGQNAVLKTKLTESEINGYIDAQLKKSGLPVAITKRFREAAGKMKSKADFDAKWKMFREGAKDIKSDVDWAVVAEKSTSFDASDERESRETETLNFSECAE